MKEFVSVICPTYGRVDLLEESIYSYLLLDDKDSELIVLNDFTKQKLYFDHPRIKIYNYDKRFEWYGDKKTELVRLSKGDIIIPLDDDDIFLSGYLDVCRNKIRNTNWIQQQRTFIYNVTEDKIQFSATLGLNVLFYRRHVFEKVCYQKVNTLENKLLYEELKRVYPGMLSIFSVEDTGYLSRWDETQKTNYHKRIVGVDLNFGARMENLMDNKIQIGEIPSGNITLNPHFKRDYNKMVNDFRLFSIKRSEIIRNNLFSNLPNRHRQVKSNPHVSNKWNVVKKSWQSADSFISSIQSRGITSTILDVLNVDTKSGNRVSDDIYQQRKLSCFGNDIHPKCEMLNTDKLGRSFCGACGCGSNKLAILSSNETEYNKLHYPSLACPLEKSGFSNEKS